jgi:hypothetical protein
MEGMAENRFFVDGDALDAWVEAGAVELSGSILRARRGGARFVLDEAIHVLAEATGEGDPHGLVDRVESVKSLSARGAEVLGKAVVLGESAYDGRPGFLITPVGFMGQKVPTATALRLLFGLSTAARPDPGDEELLSRYLIGEFE